MKVLQSLNNNQFKQQIEGFILAGGESRRMGQDKSILRLRNKTFIQTIAAAMSEVCGSVTLVSNSHQEETLVVVKDVYARWGALGGLHAALHNCRTEWALVVACDLPLISVELLSFLIGQRDRYEAVVPIQPDGRPQPLCALYRVDPCLTVAQQIIDEQKRRPLDLLGRVRTKWIAFSELQDMDRAHQLFVNINTPGDYEALSNVV